MSSGVAGLKLNSVITTYSLRKLRQQAIRLDDRLQHRVRNNDLVLTDGVGSDLITVEGDLQSGGCDVPTVKAIDFRPGSFFGVIHGVQFLQFSDRVVRNHLQIICILSEEVSQPNRSVAV